jgi:hypothetical protein
MCPLNVRVTANSPKLVAHHVLIDQYRHVLAAVVHGNGQADHVRRHHGTARPGLDRPAVVGGVGCLDLLQQVQVDERTFLQ